MQREGRSGNGSHSPYLRNNLNHNTMTISVTTGGYGFTHDWTLNAYGKNFYLGQDVKFCARVLGMHPRDLINAAGIKNPCDLRVESNRKAIARTICRELGITRSTIKSIEPWGLCAQ